MIKNSLGKTYGFAALRVISYGFLSDNELADKCENYCTKIFLNCLGECNSDDCYAECHRNDYICLDSKSLIFLNDKTMFKSDCL